MTLFCNLLLAIFLCCGFASDEPAPYDASQLVGNWKYTMTYCDGKPDSTADSVADYYFVFNEDRSFEIRYREITDTTLYTIAGKYNTNGKKGRVTTRCHTAVSHTVTRYTVQKITGTELVLVNKGDEGKVYTTYFVKTE